MKLVIDATTITPGSSAGVETFAYGLFRGLVEVRDEAFEVLVQQGTRQKWEGQTSGFHGYREIRSMLNAGSGWQRAARRIAPAALSRSPLAAQLRHRRAAAVSAQRGTDTAVTYYPFHRTPAAAEEFVMTVHDLRPFQPEFESGMDVSIIRENMHRASAVVCSWPHPFADARRLFPEHASKIFMIPLPVFNPPVGDFTATAPNHESPHLLYPAGLAPHKNHENLVRAMTLLPEARLICTGPPAEPVLGQLTRLIGELGLKDRVRLTGFVSGEELQRQFADCDAVIIPTKWEAASGPLFEALAWRKPVIASDIAPITEQLAFAGATAELFDPDSPAAMADAVRRWQRGPDPDYSGLNEWIWSRTWNDVARDYERVFQWVHGHDKPIDLQTPNRKETAP